MRGVIHGAPGAAHRRQERRRVEALARGGRQRHIPGIQLPLRDPHGVTKPQTGRAAVVCYMLQLHVPWGGGNMLAIGIKSCRHGHNMSSPVRLGLWEVRVVNHKAPDTLPAIHEQRRMPQRASPML